MTHSSSGTNKDNLTTATINYCILTWLFIPEMQPILYIYKQHSNLPLWLSLYIRHSSNINLHRKLLTKELDDIVLDPRLTPLPKDLRAELLAKIYAGHHMGLDPLARMGIGGTGLGLPGFNHNSHFPMSNEYPHHLLNQDLKNHQTNGLFQGQPDDYMVLDLSTTSSVQSGSSVHSSHESEDGSDEGILLDDLEEEGEEDEGNSEGEDYSQHTRRRAEEEHQDETGEVKEGQGEELDPSSSPLLLSSMGATNGSSTGILCNICHKMYSNKGTLRVHYKTVHLREMHKCKIPGCNMVFSSVRSRNRHSQNPNLHKNIPFSTIIDWKLTCTPPSCEFARSYFHSLFIILLKLAPAQDYQIKAIACMPPAHPF